MNKASTQPPTDGDIVRKVKICGLSRSGRALRHWSECPEVDALVDTGATATIISRALAELAGAEIMSNFQILHGRPQDAAWMTLQLDVPGCSRSKHLVVVSDRRAATAGPRAFMLLGHDYLHKHHVRIDYTADGSRLCCPSKRSARSK